MDRHPPFSDDAEQAVLAAMMIEPQAVMAALEIVDDTMFYAERHRRLFRAMTFVAECGATVDPLTVADQLTRTGDLERAGGKDYLGVLVDAVPHAANVAYHAKIVREKAQLRRLIEVAMELTRNAYDGATSARELARDVAGTLLPLAIEDGAGEGFQLIKDTLWPTMEQIEARAGGARGLLTGYEQIDRVTGGFREGELLILGGAEKMGKSAAALNIALRIAGRSRDEHGGAVGYVSAEMTRETLTERCLSWFSRIDGRQLATGTLRDDDFPRLARGAGLLSHLPLFIDDEAEPSLDDILARCTHLKAQHPDVRLIVVDFLQLVHAREQGLAEAIELKRVAYGLKRLAKRLKIVVLAPCQVNTKDIEDLKDQRPRLKDLQGSSGMRQAADFVALLYRPGAYDAVSADPHDMEFNFAACRRTAPFLARMHWDGPTQIIDEAPATTYDALRRL
jgi:replicative DNA helicase